MKCHQEGEQPRPLKFAGGGSIVLPAQSGTFPVGDAFATGKHADGVNIFDTYPEFREKFNGRTETDVPTTTVTPYDLTGPILDSAIITALGGEDRVEISLRHLRELMRRTQAREPTVIQPGWNIFYARDVDRALRTLRVIWRVVRRDWFVDAFSFENLVPWHRGVRVFSCVA